MRIAILLVIQMFVFLKQYIAGIPYALGYKPSAMALTLKLNSRPLGVGLEFNFNGTNFSVESLNPTFSGHADFGKRITLTVPRNGDLVSAIMLEVEIENPSGQHCYGLGNALIVQAEIEIGGQLIDRYTNNWANIYRMHWVISPVQWH